MGMAKRIAGSLLVVGMGRVVSAEPPPSLDRPSPPPCCADGKCIANPLTYGVYPTRWRHWPLECPMEVPGAEAGAQALPSNVQQEIKPYEIPPAEQEDRKAPPPTMPRAEENALPQGPGGPGGQRQPGGAQGQNTPPQSGPGAGTRTSPTYPAPSTAPYSQPDTTAPSTQPGTQPRVNPLLRSPVPPTSPLYRGNPSSDLDPPPSLPFGPQTVPQREPVREASQRTTAPISSPMVKPAQSPSHDPPPSLPISLASWEN